MPRDICDAISSAAALLAEQYPDVAEFLLQYPGPLIEHLGGESNGVGRSARTEIVLQRRNDLLRGIKTTSVARLADDLSKYFAISWPRDRTKTVCPYLPGDRRGVFWRVFQLRPTPLSRRQIYNIVQPAPF